MRTQIAITLLASSALALKTKTGSHSTVKQSANWEANCGTYTPIDISSAEPHGLWPDNWGSYVTWYNQMEDFWSIFDVESSFKYFDCGYGNGDGKIEFSEFLAGLHEGGWMPTYSCSDSIKSQW